MHKKFLKLYYFIEEFKKSKIAKDLETAFPDAKLKEIKEEE